MVSNKNSYTFKKYRINKKVIKFVYLFLLVDTIAFYYFLFQIYFSGYSKYPLATTLIILFLLVVFYFQIEKTDKELVNEEIRNYFTWGRGAGAELIVKKSLETLNGYFISDYQPGKWNIDHIFIGPTGAFAIEVKAHKGVISYLDGKLKRYDQDISGFLGQAKKGSVFINQLIKERLNKDYFVIPVLVFPNAKMDNSTNHQIENVWVGGRGFEKWVIDNCNNVLSREEIEEITNLFKEKNVN